MTEDQDKENAPGWAPLATTALLVLADGTVLEGIGFGATGEMAATGEVQPTDSGAAGSDVSGSPAADSEVPGTTAAGSEPPATGSAQTTAATPSS